MAEPPLKGGRQPLTFRRLTGLDRSGGPPPETRRGEALHPLTIPNAIGFARLALIPVFLVVAFESEDGRSTLAFALFAFIAGTDYLDGMAARITGQYSRLGALLDPLTDRLLVISGAIVAWDFELLPRWALLVLAAREAFMLLLTQVALRRGADLGVNMLGRWAVWPTMAALGTLPGLGQLGGRCAVLPRTCDDPCGHGAVPARWNAVHPPRLNLYLRKC